MKKSVTLGVIILFLVSTISVQSTTAESTQTTVYIRHNGSVEPSGVPVIHVGNVYTFTGDINGSIIVERNGVVIDGAGFTLQGTGATNTGNDPINFNIWLNTSEDSEQAIEVDESVTRESNNTGIYCSTQNLTIKNLKISQFWCGIELEGSSDNTITGNTLTNNNQAVWIHLSSNNIISDNTITDNTNGVLLKASFCTVSSNMIANNTNYGIQLDWPFNTVTENVVTNSNRGVYINAAHNTLENNVFGGNTYGLYLAGSDTTSFLQSIDETNIVDGKPVVYWVNQKDLTVPSNAGWVVLVNCSRIVVQNLEFTNKWQAAVLLVGTMDSTVTQNTVTGGDQGIRLFGSAGNVVAKNSLINNGIGIGVEEESNNNMISENTVTNNKRGIYIVESTQNTLRKNVMAENSNHIEIDCYDSTTSGALTYYINDLDTSNLVEGKPVCYWVNQKDRTVPSDARYVMLVNCTNMKIQNLNITNGTLIQLVWTTHSTITKNTVTNGGGIRLHQSPNNVISDNTLNDNVYGVYMYFSSNNSITKNAAASNQHGIRLEASSNNNVNENTLTDNNTGISLDKVRTIGGVSDPDPYAVLGLERNYDSMSNTISGNNITGSRYYGVILRSAQNIVIDNQITKNNAGVDSESDNTIKRNKITDNTNDGISISASNNIVSENNVLNNGNGINVVSASNNTFSKNTIKNSNNAIKLQSAKSNYIMDNIITNNTCGINFVRQQRPPVVPEYMFFPPNCTNHIVSGNLIANNEVGIQMDTAIDNIFTQNSFVDNIKQIYDNQTSVNNWDNGTEGNYWSSYSGNDSDGDSVGDTPYVLDQNNQDNHPLMQLTKTETTQDSGIPNQALVAVAAVIVLVLAVFVVVFWRRK
ncbi:MAG: NosD domain-containing protein [Candidatus Bathyarchaeia archaeon]|jgi:parallel beta-helix repeat protein